MLQNVNHVIASDRDMRAETDNALMLRFQVQRDFVAFERLFIRHKDVLLRFLVKLVGTRAGAEDASQHTWMKVIEVARKGTYAESRGAAFRTWLFTLARNHVIDEHHRKFSATRTVLLPDEANHEIWEKAGSLASVDPLAAVARHELVDRILQALALLPIEQREVIALWASGVDPADIAAMTNAPRETVLSRKKYAIAKLRKALGESVALEQNHE